MGDKKSTKEPMHRVNTRIFKHQDLFIKKEVKKSKGELGEGDVHRELLDLGIEVYKTKNKE